MSIVGTKEWHERQYRFRRTCNRVCGRALKWAILSYAFARIYLALYGAHPAIVPHLATTLAVLSAVGVGVFAGFTILSAVSEAVVAVWRDCRLWVRR